MSQASTAPTSVAELARLSDEMWFLAGDASVDTSWYTKRAGLAAIYAAAGECPPRFFCFCVCAFALVA